MKKEKFSSKWLRNRIYTHFKIVHWNFIFIFSKISPETAEVHAFLEYTELLELDEKILRESRIRDVHKKVQNKKQKLKQKLNKRFRDRYEKLKNKEWMEIKKMDIKRERELRAKYLSGQSDPKFTREEWTNNIWTFQWLIVIVMSQLVIALVCRNEMQNWLSFL